MRQSAEAELVELWDRIRTDPQLDRLRYNNSRMVQGSGVLPVKFFLAGPPPDATEITSGRPFSGLAGRALRSLVGDVAGLPVADVWWTHCIKYRVMGGMPCDADLSASMPHLEAEWRIIGRPRVKVLVGSAAYLMMGDPHTPLTEIRPGTPILKSRTVTWVMPHAGAGISNPKNRDRIEDAWGRLGDWVKRGDWGG